MQAAGAETGQQSGGKSNHCCITGLFQPSLQKVLLQTSLVLLQMLPYSRQSTDAQPQSTNELLVEARVHLETDSCLLQSRSLKLWQGNMPRLDHSLGRGLR